MKLEYTYAALAGALLFGTASAQTPSRTERAEEFAQSLTYADYLKGKDLRASELVGARVRNAEGDNLGEIEELVIPTRDQDDMLVIVSVGGLLDVGDKLVALPYDELRISPDGDTFYFDRTEAQLKAAPEFTHEARAEVQARSQRQVEREREREPAATGRTDADRPRTTARTDATAAESANLVLDVFDHLADFVDLELDPVLVDFDDDVSRVGHALARRALNCAANGLDERRAIDALFRLQLLQYHAQVRVHRSLLFGWRGSSVQIRLLHVFHVNPVLRSIHFDADQPVIYPSEDALEAFAATNRIDDGGSYSGDFEFLAPDIYPDFKWAAQTYQFASNGLFKADIVVIGSRNGQPVDHGAPVTDRDEVAVLPPVSGGT